MRRRWRARDLGSDFATLWCLARAGSQTEYTDFTVAREIQRAVDVRGRRAPRCGAAHAARHLTQAGVPISVTGCSGLADPSVAEFKEIARATGGSYTELTYHETARDTRTGRVKTVLTEGGVTYEAEGELSEENWTLGASEMLRRGKVWVQETLDHLDAYSGTSNNAARSASAHVDLSCFGS